MNNPMKIIFGTVSAAFAAVPGLLAVMAGLGVTPGQNKLFGAVSESFGGLALLIMWTNRGKLRGVSLHRLTKWAILFGVGGLACAVVYLIMLQLCVVGCPSWDAVLFPLWLTGKLAAMVAAQGGRSNALCHYGFASVYQEAQNSPVSLAITLMLLLIIYVAVSTCLASAFGVLAVRSAATPPSKHTDQT